MDQAEFQRLLGNLPPAPQQDPAAQQPQSELAVDPEALSKIAPGLTPPTDQPAPQANAGEELRPDGTPYSQPPKEEPGLGDPSSTDAMAGGAIKGVFETKDFLFGDTPPEQQSEFRKNVEKTTELRSQQSMVDGFSAGIAQFTIGMVGLGKLRWAAKALPWVQRGMEALEATKKGKVALESAKAAAVGAIAFDPHQERLSNLIQNTPLANPINRWLAADPSDSAAEGRVKAALESIGLDATILGTFMAGTRIWKALKAGDQAKAGRIATEFETEVSNATAQEAQPPPAAAEGGLEAQPGAAPGDAQGAAPETQPLAPTGEPADGVVPNPNPSADNPKPGSEAAGGGGATAEAVQPNIVANPTQSAKQADSALASSAPTIRFHEEDTASVLKGMEDDAEAIAKHGGWYQAIEAGHTFGKGEGIPYVKLNGDRELDDFMARTVDAAQERLDDMKGGKVLSDKRLGRLVEQRVALFNDDPALVLGLIQQAGKDASHMVAEMEAGYLVASRMFQDTYALASRIRMGDFVEFGGREAAIEELKKRLGFAASVYGSARSITAAGGRAVRRMRSEFKLDPETVSKLQALDGDQLTELLVNTEGNPRSLAKLANPNLLTKITGFAQFLLINNLVSGPKTSLINLMTNAYMVGARPMERLIGAVLGAIAGNPVSRAMLRESTKQYVYMGAAFSESFALARKAFLLNDSVLSPHRSEIWRGAQSAAPNAVPVVTPWAKWDSTKSVLKNGLVAAIGLPTRSLGAVDELTKQVVYRSKVMAVAYVDAVEEAAQSGLKGKALDDFVSTFVRDRLDNAFDEAGRGIDPVALREANIATFQQELLPNTLGKTVSTAVANHPALRLVLPFVKTPTNVLRYGWKLTPGLNALQREYREMWSGRLGSEARMQAYGQMALGTLFLGTASTLVANGRVTGGGPSDPKVASELKATGWQPYSIVVNNEDGSKTYVPYNRYDPVAMPFGIVADVQDAITALGDDEDGTTVQEAIGALSIALAKQFTSKTYLTSIGDAVDAMSDPDRAMQGWMGRTASNFVPYSAMLRQVNTDPYLREARDVADKIMATIPGYSAKVPPRFDAWGEPVYIRKGLWSNDTDSTVDREVQRLAIETGATITRPQPNHNGVDLRDLVLSDGSNAFETYQRLSSRPNPKVLPLKQSIAKMIGSETYRKAPDGAADVKGTKLNILSGRVAKYREAALKRLKRDKVVQDAFLKETRRVRAQWALTKPQRAAAQKPTLGQVGKAFGVDLGPLNDAAPQ